MNKTLKTAIFSFIGAMIMAWLGNYFYDQTKGVPVLKYITGIFNWLYVAGSNVLNYHVKVWIIIVALVFIIGGLALYAKFKAVEEVPPPDFIKYKKDIFKRWIWRWEWKPTDKGWTITNLTPYCPKDDVQLIANGDFFTRKYYCPKCETQFNEYREPVEYPADAEVLILDKINKKTYPTL